MTIAQIQMLTRNRQPHETQAGVRYKTLDAAVAEFTALMERVAQAEARTCRCQDQRGFEIDTRRDRQCDAQLTLARFRRMAAEDKRVGVV